MVLLTIVSLGFLVLIGSIWTVAFLFKRSIEGIEARTREDLARAARVLIEPAGDNQPSPLAVYTDQVGTILGARIVQQLKAAAGGVASGIAKADQSEALEGLAAGGPWWMGLLVNLLPKKYRKHLLSSPQFTGQLPMLGQGDNHQAETSTVRQRLKGGQ